MLWWTLRKLNSGDPAVRIAAIKELSTRYDDGRALEAIIGCLNDSHSDVFATAVRALAATPGAQWALNTRLESPDQGLRRSGKRRVCAFQTLRLAAVSSVVNLSPLAVPLQSPQSAAAGLVDLRRLVM